MNELKTLSKKSSYQKYHWNALASSYFIDAVLYSPKLSRVSLLLALGNDA